MSFFFGIPENDEANQVIVDESIVTDLSDDLNQFTNVMSQLLARTYQSGVVSIPSAINSGTTLVFHEDTDYTGIQFTLGMEWQPYLEDLETEVWFTMKKNSSDKALSLDAQGYVYDAAARVCRLNITGKQMNLIPCEYSWQLQLRKTIVTGVAPNEVTTIEKRPALEGKALVKPLFKG